MSELPDSERRCNWTVAQVKDLQAERGRLLAERNALAAAAKEMLIALENLHMIIGRRSGKTRLNEAYFELKRVVHE